MTLFNQFSVLAESRGEGLHPLLQALLERAASPACPDISVRHDGLIQAGPSPESENASNMTLFSRELARPVAAAPKPEMRRLSTANPKRERVV